MTPTISLNDFLSRSPRLAQRLFEQRMLIITVDDSQLHRLNEVATYIWQQLETPKTVREITAGIGDHFEGESREKIEKDTLRFIRKLIDKNLVVVQPAASGKQK